jgi:hypothetical protein
MTSCDYLKGNVKVVLSFLSVSIDTILKAVWVMVVTIHYYSSREDINAMPCFVIPVMLFLHPVAPVREVRTVLANPLECHLCAI